MPDRAGLCLRYGSQLRCLLQRKSRAPSGALLLKMREKQKGHPLDVLFVVREAGVEPARPCEHWHLKPASLPIPPLARGLECTVCSVHEIYYHILPPVSTLFFLHRPFFLFLTLCHRERHRFVRFRFPIYYILISTKSAFFTLSSPIFARSSQKKFSKKLLFVKIPH